MLSRRFFLNIKLSALSPSQLSHTLGRGSIERALWRGRKALGTMDRNASDNTHRRIGLILLFFASYIVSATVFQLRSETPPWVDSSPIEYFTGGLLWMSSLISLLMAEILLIESRELNSAVNSNINYQEKFDARKK